MNITFFTGAGMSKESGIPTFRTGVGNIWNKYDPQIYCHKKSWGIHTEKMLDFGNELRQTIEKCKPNKGHYLIAGLEEEHNVNIITTNVDNLHEKAGSHNVIHIHGNMFEQIDENLKEPFSFNKDIKLGDLHYNTGKQLRYNIVMFGEMPYNLKKAKQIIDKSDILVVVGTSLSVYPAAGLVFVNNCRNKYYIDLNAFEMEGFNIIKNKASLGIKEFIQKLNQIKL